VANQTVLDFGGATSSIKGAVSARNDASPAPMAALASRSIENPGAAAQSTTPAVQIAKPTPIRRIAL
jgi:hypothetical protein